MGMKKTGRRAFPREAKAKKGIAKPVTKKKRAGPAADNAIDLTGDEDMAGSNAGMNRSSDVTADGGAALTSKIADYTIPASGEEYSSPAKSSNSDPKQNTPFHKLPGELRNRTYHYTCLKSVRIELHAYKEPSLALAIPDFRPEIQNVVLAQNQLDAIVYTTFQSQESNSSYSRAADHDDSYGAGTFAIPVDSWL